MNVLSGAKPAQNRLSTLIYGGVTALVLLAVIANFAQNISRVLQSADTAWLIKTGEYILSTHRLPSSDIFSWTSQVTAWVPYQWLFELLLGSLFQTGGLWLVGLVAALFSAVVYFWILPQQMLKEHVRLPVVGALLILAMSPVWFWARPQLVSFVLIPVFINLLESFRTGGYCRKLWLLPPLMVLWCNAHSFWFIGLLVVGAYVIGELPRISELATRRRLLLLLVLCCAAVLVNPFGWSLVQHNLSFLSEPDFKHIPELQPHLLVNPLENIGTVGYFLVVWIALIAGRRGVPFYGLLLASVSSVAALCFYRFVPIAVLLSWPYLALVLGKFALTAQSSSALKKPAVYFANALPLAAVAIGVLSFIRMFPPSSPVWFTYDMSNRQAIRFLLHHRDLTDHMFCDAAVGCSQIMVGLTPVFIDSRFDAYSQSFCQQWRACLEAEGDWKQYLRKWDIRTVCISTRYKLAAEMKSNSDWILVFDDGTTNVWLRNDSQGQQRKQEIAAVEGASIAH